VSAIDCADDEHHRIMQCMQDKTDEINRKRKQTKEIVRQRKIEDNDDESFKNRRDIQQFLLTTNQFMHQWDKRILEETNEVVDSIHVCKDDHEM